MASSNHSQVPVTMATCSLHFHLILRLRHHPTEKFSLLASWPVWFEFKVSPEGSCAAGLVPSAMVLQGTGFGKGWDVEGSDSKNGRSY
jgi:hypothetical protein